MDRNDNAIVAGDRIGNAIIAVYGNECAVLWAVDCLDNQYEYGDYRTGDAGHDAVGYLTIEPMDRGNDAIVPGYRDDLAIKSGYGNHIAIVAIDGNISPLLGTVYRQHYKHQYRLNRLCYPRDLTLGDFGILCNNGY